MPFFPPAASPALGWIDVKDYGARGDARSVADGAIAASSPTLSSASALFAASDVGKDVSVAGAGSSGAVLETTIATYQSAQQVTLATSASTSVSGSAVFWGTDDTAAIQSALQAASASAGATTGTQWQNTNTVPGSACVVLPPTPGGYLCTGTLSIPRGVKLRGGEAAASPLDTTLLLTTQGRGNAAGTPFITLGGTAGLEGIAIFYPHQVKTSAPLAYPWAISASAGQDNFLHNCMLVNPYQGASFTTRFFISGLFGQPLKTGLHVNGPADACHLDHVQFTPQWCIDGIGAGGVEDYMLANLTAFAIERVDVLSMSDCVVYRALYGLSLGDAGQGGAWITATNVALDGCNKALIVSAAQNLGCQFDNCIFNATDGPNQSAVYIAGGDNYLCAISNSRLVSNNGNTVHVDPGAVGAAVLSLANCRLGQTVSNREANAVYAGSRTSAVRLYGCEFWSAPSAYHINLSGISGTQTAAPQVHNCTFVSPRNVYNPANKTLIENGNTDNLGLLPASSVAGGWINVKTHGAQGDGTTDDTAAITAAIAALPAAGGVLYFPAGTYVTSGGFTISTPCIIRGEGQWYGELGLADVASYNLGTTITCTSQTAVLFLVTASAVRFLDLTLSHAATPAPTAGAGIQVNSPSGFSSVCYDSVTVRGFYINWDLQNGYSWMMVNCVSYGSVLYGLRQKNTVNADAGDWTLLGCTFLPGYHSSSSTAAIRIESGGGGRIDSCKIVNADDGIQFHNGIEVDATGIATSVLNICNSSFENIANDAIHMVSGGGTWFHTTISNCEAGIIGNNGITMSATTLGDIQHVAISNCSLGVVNWPISLTNIRHVKVSNIVGVDSAVLVEAIGCDDLKDSSVPIGAQTSFSAGPVIERTYQVDAATGQTQDLMQWRDVSKSVLCAVDVKGNIRGLSVTPSGGARITSGSGAPSAPGGANPTAGDIYLRQDTPTVANQRIYVCSVGGATPTWLGIA